MLKRTRLGPQNEKLSDRKITLNPTGSTHKKGRKKGGLHLKKMARAHGKMR